MILEQAFLQLPEILHGSGYKQQDYEAGIVGALSLSVLQVLNGHNTANPISCLQHEKLFRKRGVFKQNVSPRYLRADLYIDVAKLFVANRRLSQYGWRHNLWLEAKFLRNQTANGTKHSGNKTIHVANFLADLIRLSTLVPEEKDESANGRYFLHVYDSKPELYLTFRGRKWMKLLCSPGSQKFDIKDLDKEPDTVKKSLGDFKDLSLELNVTNMALQPLTTQNPPCYWMYLTRIDSIKAKFKAHEFEMCLDRSVKEKTQGDLAEIASHIASIIHIDSTSSELSPPIETESDDNNQTAEPEHGAYGENAR